MLSLTGCSLLFEESTSGGSVLDAATADAVPPVADLPDAIVSPACEGWPAPEHFVPCDISTPGGHLDLSLSDASKSGLYIFDTDLGQLTTPAGEMLIPIDDVNSAALISISQLTVREGVTLRVVGSRALIVAAWDKIVVEAGGQIDVGSVPGEAGAGARATCPDNPADVGDAVGSQGDVFFGGGGGGGGFGGSGGDGGSGGEADGGDLGLSTTQPSTVLGGCPGASGGAGQQQNGGGGGGGIQLTAQSDIYIGGNIDAGGEGGGGGIASSGGGGGGGGSGGMVGLEAPTVQLETGAFISANGGGGGGGACGNGSTGSIGQNGRAGAGAAPGGQGATDVDFTGGRGGNGGFGATVDGLRGADADGCGTGGGGGGGVGAGYVIINAMMKTGSGRTSPTASEPL